MHSSWIFFASGAASAGGGEARREGDGRGRGPDGHHETGAGQTAGGAGRHQGATAGDQQPAHRLAGARHATRLANLIQGQMPYTYCVCVGCRPSSRSKHANMRLKWSPPKRKKNIRWIKWLWSWNWSGRRPSGDARAHAHACTVCVSTGACGTEIAILKWLFQN